MKLSFKLWLIITIPVVILLTATYLLTSYSFTQGLAQQISEREREEHKTLGQSLENWTQLGYKLRSLRHHPDLWQKMTLAANRGESLSSEYLDEWFLSRSKPKPLPKRPPKRKEDRRPPPPIPHTISKVLLNKQKQPIVGQPEEVHRILPIHNPDGVLIAYVGTLDEENLLNDYDVAFSNQQTQVFTYVFVFGIFIYSFSALFIARYLSHRLQGLAKQANEIERGQYSNLKSQFNGDEIGQLEQTIHALGTSLQKQENNRREWLANIAHELRTPLTIIIGELDALLDGVRRVDEKSLRSLQEEANQLMKLIEDLNTLTHADLGALTFEFTSTDLVKFVSQFVESHKGQASVRGFNLTLDSSYSKALAKIDQTRVSQVLSNLLANSIKYTDTPGSIYVSVQVSKLWVYIDFEDTSPSVPDASLDKLFEVMYRTENSRNRKSGGSGLGLSICKSIMLAHEGSISADHSKYGGLAIRLAFPLEAIK